MPRVGPAVVVLALVIAAAPAAHAQRCVAPPGTSAVEQYCEWVPDAGGARHEDGAATGGPRVSAPTLRALTRSAEGSQLAEFLREDAAEAPHKRPVGDHNGSTTRTTHGSSSDPLGAVSSAIKNGPVLGSAFAWVLVGLSLAMAAWGWTAYRRRPRG